MGIAGGNDPPVQLTIQFADRAIWNVEQPGQCAGDRPVRPWILRHRDGAIGPQAVGQGESVGHLTKPYIIGNRGDHDALQGRQQCELVLMPFIGNRLTSRSLGADQKAIAGARIKNNDHPRRVGRW